MDRHLYPLLISIIGTNLQKIGTTLALKIIKYGQETHKNKNYNQIG